MLAKNFDAVAGEDTKHVSLVVVEFIRSRPAKVQQILAEKVSDTRETEMGQLRAVDQHCAHALNSIVSGELRSEMVRHTAIES